jgi:hypothetical protein
VNVVVNNAVAINSQIVDDSETKDQKKISTLDYQLKNGDLIYWQNEKWINILTDNLSDIYYRGILRRCVGSLKWLDEAGDINERYFTFKSDPATNFGIDEGRIITLGNERRTLLVSYDDDTKTLRKDKRFLFDTRAWKITAIDNISIKGISIITVQEDQIDTAKDNIILQIADYIPPHTVPEVPVDVDTVEINGDLIITKSKSKTYTCIFTRNGTPFTDNGIFSLADQQGNKTSLGTIDSQGNNTCSVKGVGLGIVVLHVSNTIGTIKNKITIQIKSAI